VARGAGDAEIHAAYRDAVRRTHPDAGGSAAAFEAVQEAYEALRDPARRRAWDAAPKPAPPPPRTRPAAADMRSASRRMEDLLAESRRLEDEARRLAGMAPRRGDTASAADGSADSVTAILRDAGEQLRDAAGEGARELRRRLRRVL